MKTKIKTVFRCSQCEQESPRWLGQCPGCQSWNTMEQTQTTVKAAGKSSPTLALSVMPFAQASEGTPESGLKRHSTGFPRLNSILGTGLLDGSLVLLGGPPGVGKSTLVAHIAGSFIAQGHRVFMASGEEEVGQIASRLSRLGIKKSDGLYLASAATAEGIEIKTEELMPQLLIIDSIQTVPCESLDYPMGSPGLIRALTGQFLHLAKNRKIVVMLLGHVTKDGLLAGPKHMEHMVDVVLQMEKPRAEEFRLLRVAKNRFGPANQLAVFSMDAKGLNEVSDPSASFLSQEWRERLGQEKGRIGLASTLALEGGQPFLLQVEALIGKRKMSPGKRASLGIERSRLEIILAVLEKTMGVSLEYTDVFISVVGGVKVRDPGCDLAVALALASSILDVPLSTAAAFVGEISLSGDVLKPKDLESRTRQAQELGYGEVWHARKGLYHLRDFIDNIRRKS